MKLSEPVIASAAVAGILKGSFDGRKSPTAASSAPGVSLAGPKKEEHAYKGQKRVQRSRWM